MVLSVVCGCGNPECANNVPVVSPRAKRLVVLDARRTLMVSYLLAKVEEQDWHGVQDAASDLRDIEAEVKGLEQG